ncbi:MAG TPA: LPXTG cell wall anchor domain-containing protein [Verrucomicrobiae bacterium]|nr:LPXTG cell wall anchor domain-containing protein [Verrucomicrobiae bacterium]
MCALYPAVRGNKPVTFILITPAVLAVLAITTWLGYGYVADGLHDPDFEFGNDFLMPWILLAGAPMGTSLAAVFVLWFRRKKRSEAQLACDSMQ